LPGTHLNQNLKNTVFVDTILNVLRDPSFSQNQPLKPADDQYIRILKNVIKKLWKSGMKLKNQKD
jgi:hypothetical protein